MVTSFEFDPKGFGVRLRRAIDYADTNQSRLGAKIGQPRSRVSEWVHGKRVPSLPDVIAMAGELRVSLDWLVAGTESTTPERTVVDELAQLAPSLLPIMSQAERLARG
jgi:transcriptional regulator with XRE-family HTH domain